MSSGRAQLCWDQVSDGDRVPRVTLEISYKRVILNVGATWDYFPGHYDPEYARANGHKTIFANTSLFLGFVDRVITDWAGPRTFIAKRKLTMVSSIHPGDVMYGEGTVVRRRQEGTRHLIDLELEVGNSERVCALAAATIVLPKESK